MAAPKLIYFDFPGKAEAIRLALTHAGVAFEDHRFADRAEFQALKASGRLQFGQVPALEVTTAAGETTVLTQSAAILRYVAKLNDSANLYPADPLLAARVSSAAEAHKLAGNAKFKAGEYEAAARCYSEAIAVDRTQPTFFTNRAACHRRCSKISTSARVPPHFIAGCVVWG